MSRPPPPRWAPTPGSGPDGPVVLHASVHSVPGVRVSSALVGDHSTAVAQSCASPAGGAPASVGRWPPTRQRALRGCGYTRERPGASAPTAPVGTVVWYLWVSIIRGMDTSKQVSRAATT